MWAFLSSLKSKLLLALGGIIGVLLLFIRVLIGKNSKLKRKHDKEKLDQSEARYKAKVDAVNALKKGLENEKKPVNRGYFDDNA